jgi:outer membrane receptor protein involved in Fe transport
MKRLFLTLLILCSLVAAYSQPNPSFTISGKVTNDRNEALAGASIKVKGSNTGTIADQDARYRITVPSLPVILLVSHTNYTEQEIKVENTNEMSISLIPVSALIEGVFLISKGIPTRIMDYNSSAEFMGPSSNRQLPATSIYDAIVYKKGFDHSTSSATFKTPSSRGFNGSGSTRVNQIVDGMDNQAPGLNFFVGNFAGITDLDFESIELLPGASSALYGPGGMNGTILINSKNPFEYPGLSVVAKQGIMHVGKSQRNKASAYNDYSIRWAKAFNNKFAFKIGAQYISAQDWLAGDTTNYQRSGTSGKLIPGNRMTDPNYDGVNVYGDETSVDIRAFMRAAIPGNPGLLPVLSPFLNDPQYVSRTGYHEKDVIDPVTKNIKLSGALHYKLTNKIEAQLMGYWSTGNTVYTDDNRYVLKGIKIGQYKLELKHKNWFLRSYTTQEDAGEAYSSTVATQYVNEAWKRSFNEANIPGSWYPQYFQVFATQAATEFQRAYIGALTNGQSPQQALATAQTAVVNGASQFHQAGRAFADRDRPVAGSSQFKKIFDQVRNTPIPKGGLFKEQSQLWMTEGQYTFGDAVKSVEIIVGGNYKKYILDSDGTLFIDTSKAIGINEVGTYMQVTRKLFNEKLVLTTSGRFDKNENFKAQFTPRFAAIVKLAKDHNLRMSYQTAYRFPGNLAQWIRLDVGGDYLLLGGLPWVMDYMHADKNPVHLINDDRSIEVNPYQYRDFKPETMRSFEIGYKGLIKNKLLIDAYGYAGKYKDFIGRIGLYQPNTGEAFSITVNSSNKVKTYGFGLGMDYRMKDYYSLFFNVYSDVITDVPAGFKAYFNAPKYRFNAGIANDSLGKNKRIGFSVMMRWQDAFEWEGELANGPLIAFTTVDAQVSYKFPKLKSTIRLGGTNIFNNYYKNAYGNPEIGGLYYAAYIYNF